MLRLHERGLVAVYIDCPSLVLRPRPAKQPGNDTICSEAALGTRLVLRLARCSCCWNVGLAHDFGKVRTEYDTISEHDTHRYLQAK